MRSLRRVCSCMLKDRIGRTIPCRSDRRRPMHLKLTLCAASAMVLLALPARAGWGWDWNRVPPFQGNDTGGIIAWSPVIKHVYRRIAADHCAHYNKVAHITSVHRQYGDYVGFECRW